MTESSDSIGAVALALCSAAVYGSADFFGGLATRRTSALAVVFVSQIAGLATMAVAVALLPRSNPSAGDFIWGAWAGAFGTLGIVLLYEALATGRMSTVAPVTGVCAISLPIFAGLALGERPLLRAEVGLVFALAAIVLVAQEVDRPSKDLGRMLAGLRFDKPVALALFAGVAIGFFFICLKQTHREAGQWPLLGARAVSVSSLGIIGLIGRRPLAVPAAQLPLILGVGVADMAANVLYAVAAQRGLLSLVATITSLYPAATIVWARIVLGERIRPLQAVGLGFAALAIFLIAS